MSVQVLRRREAAAFLASFVGAQGELLVDTTNKRVQVHDGVTPNGWPAAAIRDMAGFNLGINTNGASNQRGVSGTVTLAAGAYGHDRMKAGANGCTYTFSSAADGDTTFTITAGSLIQAVDVGNVFSTAMWLTWTGTVLARVYQGAASTAPALGAGSAVPIDGTMVNAILATGLALGTMTLVEFGTGTLNTTRPWQLEVALPNAGPTRFGRRHGELALCQRYFFAYSVGANLDYFYAILGGQPYLSITFPFPVPMRAVPTVAVTGSTSGTFGPGMPGVYGATTSRAYLRGDAGSGAISSLLTLTASAEL